MCLLSKSKKEGSDPGAGLALIFCLKFFCVADYWISRMEPSSSSGMSPSLITCQEVMR